VDLCETLYLSREIRECVECKLRVAASVVPYAFGAPPHQSSRVPAGAAFANTSAQEALP